MRESAWAGPILFLVGTAIFITGLPSAHPAASCGWLPPASYVPGLFPVTLCGFRDPQLVWLLLLIPAGLLAIMELMTSVWEKYIGGSFPTIPLFLVQEGVLITLATGYLGLILPIDVSAQESGFPFPWTRFSGWDCWGSFCVQRVPDLMGNIVSFIVDALAFSLVGYVLYRAYLRANSVDQPATRAKSFQV